MTKPQIMFIDDEQQILNMFRRMLRAEAADWDLHFFSNSTDAWTFLQNHPVDAIVSDVTMPNLSGLELLKLLHSQNATRDVPVAMLTGSGDAELKRQVLDLGATDLLNKPLQASDLLSRLRSMLRLKFAEDELKRRNLDLESLVQQRTRQLQQSRLQIIWRLGKAAEFRDEETGEHVVRVGSYSRIIGAALGLPKEFTSELLLAAPLHDIGKIGIPDAILLKPGRLTPAERAVMEKHCEIGERILREPSMMELCSGSPNERIHPAQTEADNVMEMAKDIALSHHERWDGSGYPNHVASTSIPLAARIVSVADVYDALTSVRPYKTALPEDEAIRIISHGSGTQFDPQVVEAFLRSVPALVDARRQISAALGPATPTSRSAGNSRILPSAIQAATPRKAADNAEACEDLDSMFTLIGGLCPVFSAVTDFIGAHDEC